jgi:hypothetical protein
MTRRLAQKLIVPFFLLTSFGALLAPVAMVSAQSQAAQSGGQYGLDQTVNEINGGTGGKNTVYDVSATPEQIIGRIIKYILEFTGLIFFVLMIYAGFTWMMSQGDQKKVTEAKGTITAAIIGIVVIALAYGITSYVLTNITGG